MEDSTPPPDEPARYCPFCGKPLGVSDPAQAVLQCPDCGQQFFLSTAPEDDSTADAEQVEARADDEEAQRDAELSEMRISQVASLRRGAIRTRSWFIVVAAACVVVAIQFIYLAIEKYRVGQRRDPLRDVLCAGILLVIVPFVTRRILQLGSEIAESRLKDPTTPPDFSTLSDGSQRWTNLDQLAGRDEKE